DAPAAGTNGDARGRSIARGAQARDHAARGRRPELRGDRPAHGLPDRHGPLAHLPGARGDRPGAQAPVGQRYQSGACGTMIHVDDNEPVQIRPDPDKLFLYHRQQLSAMLDGELSPDEARFMLRRLQHDTVLAACWERRQVCGDVLRGQRNDLLPPDLAQRGAPAVAGDAGEGGRDASVRLVRPRIARWGGGAAIAASVALLAVFASRQLPVPGQSPATGERTSLVAELAAPTAPEPAPPVARQPAGAAGRELADAVAHAPGEVAGAGSEAALALAASAAALADTPRRAAERGRGPARGGAHQRPVPDAAGRCDASLAAVAAALGRWLYRSRWRPGPARAGIRTVPARHAAGPALAAARRSGRSGRGGRAPT